MKIPFKNLIIAILSIKEQLYEAYKDNEEFKSILEYFMSEDFYGNEDLSIPTGKSIKEATGLSDHQIRKRVKKLHEEIIDMETGPGLKFDDFEIICFTKDGDNHASFKMKDMKHLPNVGDNLYLPFLTGKYSMPYFYVDSITHEFENNQHIIILFLTNGFYNHYWHIRKAEAKAKRDLSYDELKQLSEYDIKEKFGLR